MRQKAALVFCLMFFSLFLRPSAHAQTDSTAVLTAFIQDGDTSARLPYAAVIIRQQVSALPRVYITDLYGHIELKDVKPETVHVQARHQGYVTADTTLVLRPGLITSITLSLSPRLIQLSEEISVQELPASELISRLITNPRFEYLHINNSEVVTYTFDAHSHQEVIDRRTDQVVAGMEYALKGYYHMPDSLAQHITGLRSWGKWKLSLSPGLTQTPARGNLGTQPFEIVPHPLSKDALQHYHFEIISTVQVGDLHVSRIGVSPRQKRKPRLLGDIWIARDDFSLVGYDLRLNFPALRQLPNIDHWQIYQQNARYLNRYWLPARQTMNIQTRAWIARATIWCYRHDLNANLPTKVFEGSEIQILTGASKRDSVFWSQHTASQDTTQVHLQNALLKGTLPAAWQQLGLRTGGQ